MMVGMIVVACLLAVLSLVMSAVASCDVWRDVGDVLCFLIMLVLGMIIVFVFSE